MIIPRMTVLVVGATGSIGRLVVEEAIRQGHAVRALVRTPGKARRLPPDAQVVLGDVTRPDTLPGAVDGVDAVVFTLGSDGAGKVGAESVDYGGVRNVLGALGSRKARIALMTAIGVTNRTGEYNRATEAHDWKRRSERLVRASGLPYTIVRPGWFDYNKSGRASSCPPAGRYAAGRRSQRWRHCSTSGRRSPGPQPRLGLRSAQNLRTHRDRWPGAGRLRRAVRRSRCGPARRPGRRARHGKPAAERRAEAGA